MAGDNTKSSVGGTVYTFVALVFVVSFVVVSAVGSKSDDKATAIAIARNAVTKNLISPATALFPSSSDEYSVTHTLHDDSWRVEGYVDAQNGFGALIRKKWVVEMVRDNGSWSIIEDRSFPN